MEGLIIFIIGISIGSFINVIVARHNSKDSAFVGRSKCSHCQAKLSWYELIPIFSFIYLQGRCGHCEQRISPQYLFVELLNGLAFLVLFLTGLNVLIFAWLAVLFSISLAIAVYDFKHLILPDSFLLVFLVWAILGNLLFWRDTIVTSVLSGFILAAFFLALFLISKGKWIGGGDIKLGALLGFWLGWPSVAIMFMISYILGAFVALILLSLRRVKKQSQLPFAPFMLTASFIVFLWGQEILSWYIGLIF